MNASEIELREVKLNDYLNLEVSELRKILGQESRLNRDNMVHQIVTRMLEDSVKVCVVGVLETVSEHFGFLRFMEADFRSTVNDVYVPLNRKGSTSGLKEGDEVSCTIQMPIKSKYLQINEIITVNNLPLKEVYKTKHFSDFTATFPTEWVELSSKVNTLITRILDLVVPIGLGQRGVIGASPKCGKTTVIESLAKSFHDYGCRVIVLMLAERPEETTYLKNRLPDTVRIITSNFDEDPYRHVKLAHLVKEYCKRKVEQGENCVLLIDSLTRFVRAANLMETSSSKTLSGGLDAQALLKIKSVLGAGRNLLNGGSLTIVATALIETGSKMDDVIFDECKSTTNWDLILTKEFTEKGIFPAVDVPRSSTRRCELFLEESDHKSRIVLRKILSTLSQEESLRRLIELVKSTDNNQVIFSRFLSFNKENKEGDEMSG